MQKLPMVSIIIANWNNKTLLKDCLTSIKEKTNYSNFNVIVVDNGSEDDSVEMVRKEFPWIELTINEENLGFAKANNQAIKYMFKRGAEYFLLLNNDTKITQKDWLRKIIKVAESNPRIGIVGCRIIHPNGRVQQHYQYSKTGSVNTVIGATFLIKKEVVEKIGLFDEKFTPVYGEDLDYCFRAKKAGYQIIYTPETTIIHHGRASSGENRQSMSPIEWEKFVRVQLLNYSFKQMMIALLWTALERKEKESGIINFKLREDWNKRFCLLLRAFVLNIKDLPEILRKRRDRLMKIWEDNDG